MDQVGHLEAGVVRAGELEAVGVGKLAIKEIMLPIRCNEWSIKGKAGSASPLGLRGGAAGQEVCYVGEVA